MDWSRNGTLSRFVFFLEFLVVFENIDAYSLGPVSIESVNEVPRINLGDFLSSSDGFERAARIFIPCFYVQCFSNVNL